MQLGDLIEFLKGIDPAKVCRFGFKNPHSYRGYYKDLAFEPAENVTVGEMLAAAESALGETFTGYKGGDYTMGEHTDCWLANYGSGGGEGIGPILLRYMTGDAESSLAAMRHVVEVSRRVLEDGESDMDADKGMACVETVLLHELHDAIAALDQNPRGGPEGEE